MFCRENDVTSHCGDYLSIVRCVPTRKESISKASGEPTFINKTSSILSSCPHYLVYPLYILPSISGCGTRDKEREREEAGESDSRVERSKSRRLKRILLTDVYIGNRVIDNKRNVTRIVQAHLHAINGWR